MNLTRRDFLRGGAVTAIALAVGLKAKIAETIIAGVGRSIPQLFDNLSLSVMFEPEIVDGKFELSEARIIEIAGLVPVALNISPELMQMEADWDEWQHEIGQALAAKGVAEIEEEAALVSGGHLRIPGLNHAMWEAKEPA